MIILMVQLVNCLNSQYIRISKIHSNAPSPKTYYREMLWCRHICLSFNLCAAFTQLCVSEFQYKKANLSNGLGTKLVAIENLVCISPS